MQSHIWCQNSERNISEVYCLGSLDIFIKFHSMRNILSTDTEVKHLIIESGFFFDEYLRTLALMKSKQLGLNVLFFKKIVTAQLPRWLVEELMKPYTIKVLISFNKLILRREYDLFWDAFPESLPYSSRWCNIHEHTDNMNELNR